MWNLSWIIIWRGFAYVVQWRYKIEVLDKKFAITDLLKPSKNRQNTKESVFYVPAQRILGISDGRPKNFMEFDGSAPFVLKTSVKHCVCSYRVV